MPSATRSFVLIESVSHERQQSLPVDEGIDESKVTLFPRYNCLSHPSNIETPSFHHSAATHVRAIKIVRSIVAKDGLAIDSVTLSLLLRLCYLLLELSGALIDSLEL